MAYMKMAEFVSAMFVPISETVVQHPSDSNVKSIFS